MHHWGSLGEVLRRSPGNAANVVRATAAASALLKTVRDTFPAYTLHDEQHAINVVQLMDRLAAPRMERMDPLEAALLILSAYLHDVGMSYTSKERDAVVEEEEFRTFLRDDPSAFLAVHHNGGIPTPAVIEQYGRVRHADRVRVHLDRMERAEPGVLRWDGISLVPTLHRLCRSHNESAGSLLSPEFGLLRGRADVRFCAVLLRLADIMDFGRSRAPHILYDYLGLAGPDTAAAAESARHWEINMAGVGFDFPHQPPSQWQPGYRLTFAANPEDPDVEHAIRGSLDAVRTELELCRPVRDSCERWGDLPLPGVIDDSQIEGLGYTYREFRFELDRSAVLELFTGEELYGDPSVALRELLQNAIDAVQSRLRIHGDVPGAPPGVDVTCWEDAQGFVWVRVDDTGTGMDERIIREYFLRVGRSYYNSPEFEADLVRSENAGTFLPVSRFGIGVLSCFLAGDRVEVSTRRLIRGGRDYDLAVPLRLSLHRDRDYFVLRTGAQGAEDMPAATGDEGCRRLPGTGIAIRIDPHRTGLDLAGLTEAMERFIYAPPVPVTFNGRQVDARSRNQVEVPWLDHPVVTALSTADRVCEEFAGVPYLAGMRVVALPLDLSATKDVTSVSGQLLATVAIPAEDYSRSDLLAGWSQRPLHGDAALAECVWETEFHIDWRVERSTRKRGLRASVTRWVDTDSQMTAMDALSADGGALKNPVAGATENERAAVLAGSASALFAALAQIPPDDPETWNAFWYDAAEAGLSDLTGRLDDQPELLVWAHGGIRLPTSTFLSTHFALSGALCLTGPLRPDLTVSRSEVRAIPLRVHSAVHLALRRAAARLEAPPEALSAVMRQTLLTKVPDEDYSIATFGREPLIAGGEWDTERVIPTLEGIPVSCADLRSLAAEGEHLDLDVPHARLWKNEHQNFDFYHSISTALVDLFVGVEFAPEDTGRLVSTSGPARTRMSPLLPPLFAVPYRVTTGGMQPARAPRARRSWDEPDGTDGWLNVGHPLASWISDHADRLARDFPAPFNRVFRNAPWLEDPEEINMALDRVKVLHPPAEAYVRVDEDGWWWSR